MELKNKQLVYNHTLNYLNTNPNQLNQPKIVGYCEILETVSAKED